MRTHQNPLLSVRSLKNVVVSVITSELLKLFPKILNIYYQMNRLFDSSIVRMRMKTIKALSFWDKYIELTEPLSYISSKVHFFSWVDLVNWFFKTVAAFQKWTFASKSTKETFSRISSLNLAVRKKWTFSPVRSVKLTFRHFLTGLIHKRENLISPAKRVSLI